MSYLEPGGEAQVLASVDDALAYAFIDAHILAGIGVTDHSPSTSAGGASWPSPPVCNPRSSVSKMYSEDPSVVFSQAHLGTIGRVTNEMRLGNTSVSDALNVIMEQLQGLTQNEPEYLASTLRRHLKQYLISLLPESGIAFYPTSRYTKDPSVTDICILATRHFRKGETVQLCGSIAQLSLGENSRLRNSNKDFSVLYSSRRRAFTLLLGPARFVNHDCTNNVEFCLSGKTVSFRATRDIQPNEEIFTYYGDHYFDDFNARCLCKTCERKGAGAFKQKDDNDKSDPADVPSQSAPPTTSNLSDSPSRGLRRRLTPENSQIVPSDATNPRLPPPRGYARWYSYDQNTGHAEYIGPHRSRDASPRRNDDHATPRKRQASPRKPAEEPVSKSRLIVVDQENDVLSENESSHSGDSGFHTDSAVSHGSDGSGNPLSDKPRDSASVTSAASEDVKPPTNDTGEIPADTSNSEEEVARLLVMLRDGGLFGSSANRRPRTPSDSETNASNAQSPTSTSQNGRPRQPRRKQESKRSRILNDIINRPGVARRSQGLLNNLTLRALVDSPDVIAVSGGYKDKDILHEDILWVVESRGKVMRDASVEEHYGSKPVITLNGQMDVNSESADPPSNSKAKPKNSSSKKNDKKNTGAGPKYDSDSDTTLTSLSESDSDFEAPSKRQRREPPKPEAAPVQASVENVLSHSGRLSRSRVKVPSIRDLVDSPQVGRIVGGFSAEEGRYVSSRTKRTN